MSIRRVTNLNHFLVQLSKTTKFFFFCTPVIFIILIMLTITFF